MYSELNNDLSSLHSFLQEQNTKAFLSEGTYFFSSGRMIGDKLRGIRGSSFLSSFFVIDGIRIYNVKNEMRIKISKKSIKRIIFKIT